MRHPTDYWLRYALAADIDPDRRRRIEDLRAQLRSSYQRLRGRDWRPSEAAAPIVCTVKITTSEAGASKTPGQAVVTTPEQPFNGKLLSVMVG